MKEIYTIWNNENIKLDANAKPLSAVPRQCSYKTQFLQDIMSLHVVTSINFEYFLSYLRHGYIFSDDDSERASIFKLKTGYTSSQLCRKVHVMRANF
jgi:hypothetical protein